MKFDPNRHHRRSIRLPGYNYSQPGAYFVTICTHERECIFGVIENQTVILSISGEIVANCWCALTDHFVFIELDTYVVMPNHVHGIIVIKDYGQVNFVASSSTKPRSLGSVIQNFKSISTRKIKQEFKNEGVSVWQRNYYGRVNRDEIELSQVRQYIETNLARWKKTP